jgi:hypothetical protein
MIPGFLRYLSPAGIRLQRQQPRIDIVRFDGVGET